VEASSTEEIQIFQEKEIILKLHLQEGNKERNHLFDKLKNYEQKMKELEGVVQHLESSKKTTTKKDDIDLFFLCSFENVVEKIKDLNRGLLLLLGGISPD
jgi:chromosome segregation ATPase